MPEVQARVQRTGEEKEEEMNGRSANTKEISVRY
jgi:hypothetical protein